MRRSDLPFRLGTTSYIIPDDILPNVRFLTGKMRDIQLVLFEVDDQQSNIPDKKIIGELNAIASQSDLTYTIHLPLDLRLAANHENLDMSLVKARRVIEATRELSPLAYVVHLDGKEERGSNDPNILVHWQDQAIQSLEYVAGIAGHIRLLAVENLEGYPPSFNDQVIERSGCSRCIDIGHLWLDGHNPAAYFPGRLEQTSIIHIHGISSRDHKSLRGMSAETMDGVFRYLLNQNYRGVLTIEVFSEDDLLTSLLAIDDCLDRIQE